MTIDNYIPCHIMQRNNKGCDKDKYALNHGTESRYKSASLPVLATPNGPSSRNAKLCSREVTDAGLLPL